MPQETTGLVLEIEHSPEMYKMKGAYGRDGGNGHWRR